MPRPVAPARGWPAVPPPRRATSADTAELSTATLSAPTGAATGSGGGRDPRGGPAQLQPRCLARAQAAANKIPPLPSIFQPALPRIASAERCRQRGHARLGPQGGPGWDTGTGLPLGATPSLVPPGSDGCGELCFSARLCPDREALRDFGLGRGWLQPRESAVGGPVPAGPAIASCLRHGVLGLAVAAGTWGTEPPTTPAPNREQDATQGAMAGGCHPSPGAGRAPSTTKASGDVARWPEGVQCQRGLSPAALQGPASSSSACRSHQASQGPWLRPGKTAPELPGPGSCGGGGVRHVATSPPLLHSSSLRRGEKEMDSHTAQEDTGEASSSSGMGTVPCPK